MARAGSVYPQVELTAGMLMDRRVAVASPRATVSQALRSLRRAEILITGRSAAARRRDVALAARWGLGRLRVARVAWIALPTVPASASEVAVRRLLERGVPIVLVTDGRRVVGAVDAASQQAPSPTLSVSPRLDRLGDHGAEARLWLLRLAGKVGEATGSPVYAVGGCVRDLLLGRDSLDVDLVVEGDAIALARRLADEVRGTVVVHPAFATASIEGGVTRDGTGLGRVDIASARREHYERAGALPEVTPATLAEDLRRRDFSVNAMAVALSPSEFGRLLDPLGGHADLRARRLRVLHPLSFVEDPTRVFRAARYAARLRLRLDQGGRVARELAMEAGPYAALSGQRLRAELDLLASEPTGWAALEALAREEAFRLWDRGYRGSRLAGRRLQAARRFMAWTRTARLAVDPGEVALVALLLDQRGPVAARSIQRLAITGAPGAELRFGLTAGRSLARRLDGRSLRRASAVVAALRRRPRPALIAAWLLGGRRARGWIAWFVRYGHAVRPDLSGARVVALGVPRGPLVGECLAALRDRRLDGTIGARGEEERFVKAWLRARMRAGRLVIARKGDSG